MKDIVAFFNQTIMKLSVLFMLTGSVLLYAAGAFWWFWAFIPYVPILLLGVWKTRSKRLQEEKDKNK